MAFNRQQNITVTGYGDISINLFVPKVIDVDNPQIGEIEVQIILSDGTIKNSKYDLLTRLGDDSDGLTHRDNLIALRDYLKLRIETEVLP